MNVRMTRLACAVLVAASWVLCRVPFLEPAIAAPKARFVASDTSDRYHLSTCKVAQKIHPEETLRFQTPEEAVAKGLVPCKKCDPPVSSAPARD